MNESVGMIGPRLNAEGLGDVVDLLMIQNPARAFSFRGDGA
jgi:hypothetical protein